MALVSLPMSNSRMRVGYAATHPTHGIRPLRALRALQGRGIFGVVIQICVDNRDFEQALKHSRNRPYL